NSRFEVHDGGCGLLALSQHDAEAVMGLGGGFVDSARRSLGNDELELLARRFGVAHQIEGGAQLVMKRSSEGSALVCERHALAKERGRGVPVTSFERADTSQLVRQSALEQEVHVAL